RTHAPDQSLSQTTDGCPTLVTGGKGVHRARQLPQHRLLRRVIVHEPRRQGSPQLDIVPRREVEHLGEQVGPLETANPDRDMHRGDPGGSSLVHVASWNVQQVTGSKLELARWRTERLARNGPIVFTLARQLAPRFVEPPLLRPGELQHERVVRVEMRG